MNIPNWAINAVKLLSPVVIAVAIVWARFTGVEQAALDLKAVVVTVEAKQEASKDLMTQMQLRQATIELKQSVLEKSIGEALIRIETSLKDVQLDVKDLQKHNATK